MLCNSFFSSSSTVPLCSLCLAASPGNCSRHSSDLWKKGKHLMSSVHLLQSTQSTVQCFFAWFSVPSIFCFLISLNTKLKTDEPKWRVWNCLFLRNGRLELPHLYLYSGPLLWYSWLCMLYCILLLVKVLKMLKLKAICLIEFTGRDYQKHTPAYRWSDSWWNFRWKTKLRSWENCLLT